jgi:predicted membrane protein
MTTSVFPLTFQSHIVFCIVAVAFFIFQYIRLKAPYQLMTVFAILATLALYINDSKIVFYSVGIFELVMIIAIAVSMSVTRKKQARKEIEKAKTENTEINKQ